MLTVDYAKLNVRPGHRVLDLGCGGGRHAFEAARLGATIVALDRDAGELGEVAGFLAALHEAGEATDAAVVRGDAFCLPFADETFDRVIASEILEHLPDDIGAMSELVRVTRPGGLVAVTVPRFGPEVVCWALSRAYHEVDGGHVRIYRRRQLLERLRLAGLEPLAGSHHAHALHSPYWWLKCALGIERDANPLVGAYHRMLVWDLMQRPAATRLAERALDPLIGKSLVTYLRKPEVARAVA